MNAWKIAALFFFILFAEVAVLTLLIEGGWGCLNC